MLGNYSKTILKNLGTKSNLFSQLNTKNIFKKSNILLKQQKFLSSHYVNHRNTVDNNEETPFDFTKESYKKIDEILVNFNF